jgi:4-hydroxy-3-methylbut-2-enyl diphosphate reductase
MEILTAQIGLCFGITRAYRAMNEHAKDGAPLHVAHQNAAGEFDTLRRIEQRDPELLKLYPALDGVSFARDVSKLDAGDRLVLGFHGLPAAQKDDLAKRGVALVQDMQCPFIIKLDRVVEEQVAAGYDIAIVGQKDNHHCRQATAEAESHGQRCFVIEELADVNAIPDGDEGPIALVGQVTGNTLTFRDVIARMDQLKRPVKVFRTMCGDSHDRQQIAVDLAKQADVVLVVDDGGGGAQSAFEVCSSLNKRVHRIRSAADIRVDWFDGAGKVAVVGGILVPDWSLAEMAQRVAELRSEVASSRGESVPQFA